MFKGFIKKILGEQNEEMIRENERLKMQLEQANKQTVEKETNKWCERFHGYAASIEEANDIAEKYDCWF